MSPGQIRIDRAKAGTIEITIDRADKRNALTDHLAAELAEALRSADANPDTRVIVLRGAGRTFCAGADLTEVSTASAAAPHHRYSTRAEIEQALAAMLASMTPILGIIEGHAVGGGVALASLCTVVLASEETNFRFPEADIGVFPAALVPFVATRIGVPRAVEWALTGRSVTAAQAHVAGLVDEVMPAGQLDGRADELTTLLAGRPARVLRAGMETRARLLEIADVSASLSAGRLIGSLFWPDADPPGHA